MAMYRRRLELDLVRIASIDCAHDGRHLVHVQCGSLEYSNINPCPLFTREFRA